MMMINPHVELKKKKKKRIVSNLLSILSVKETQKKTRFSEIPRRYTIRRACQRVQLACNRV